MNAIRAMVCAAAVFGCGAPSPELHDGGKSSDKDAGADAGTEGCASGETFGPWTCVTSGTTRDLDRVWGSGPSDVWAVGAEGAIVHFDGTEWSSVASGTTEELHGVWGSGASNVWAVGAEGTILHWDGSAWSAAASDTPFTTNIRGVWGSQPNDVWAVGSDCSTTTSGDVTETVCANDNILHFDGSAWSRALSGAAGELYGVWGSGPDDVWAVGVNCSSRITSNVIESDCSHNNTVHWDGSAWFAVASGTAGAIVDVWSSGPDDVWAVNVGGFYVHPAILHSDGAAWSVAAMDQSGRDLWGSAQNDVWMVGGPEILRWNGSDWSPVTSELSITLTGVWGSGPDDVWAVGQAGTILHH